MIKLAHQGWVFLFFILSHHLAAQKGDSILANETTLIRPLTVHKGQFRVNGGYSLLINSRRYDLAGNKVDLSDEGFTNIGHLVDLELNYGFAEFLQVSMDINHLQEAQRSRNIVIITTPDDPIDFNEITERKGWTDLHVMLDFKVPFVTRQFDFVFSAGRSLPVAAHEPDQPEHQIDDTGPLNTITYQFLNKAGEGTAAWLIGLSGKVRTDKFGFSFDYFRQHFSGEATSISWSASLDNELISYTSRDYDYQLGDRSQLLFLSEYQAWPFLNLFLGYQAHNSGEGWSEITGIRTLVERQRRRSIQLGAEVLVTPRLWIRQVASFPTGGENSFNPLILSTRAVYNLFPFER
ncbi:MAG: hypothetical protein AAF519_04090 [Bacteroidota bacterium]